MDGLFNKKCDINKLINDLKDIQKIEIVDIVKKYKDEVVLKNISLFLNKGDVIVLKGPSGGGKTTLIRILALIEGAERGYMRINDDIDIDLSDFNYIKYIRRYIYPRISIVFQQLHLWPNLTVNENLDIIISNNKNYNSCYDDNTKFFLKEYLVEYFKVGHILHKYPQEISLGQKQRIAIIRNLLTRGEVFLWDEITSALDLDNTIKVANIINFLSKNLNKIFVIITHDIEFIKFLYKPKIFRLENGSIKYEDSEK